MATLTGGTALVFVPQTMCMGLAIAGTSGAIPADDGRFPLAIVGALLSQLAMLLLALELDRVFARLQQVLARVLLVSMAIRVALACANQLPNLIALLLPGPEPGLRVFPQAQREAAV